MNVEDKETEALLELISFAKDDQQNGRTMSSEECKERLAERRGVLGRDLEEENNND